MAVSEGELDRVGRWLYGRLDAIVDWRRHSNPAGLDEHLDRAFAGVDVFEAAGAIRADAAASWRTRLADGAAADPPTPVPSTETRAAGEALLEELLTSLSAASADDDSAYERFDGAAEL